MREPPWLLAVSGGPDSMVLLDAAAAVHPRAALTVATFDHGTGVHASEAVALVARRCAELALPVVTGVTPRTARGTEAEWRLARWRFLRDAADRLGARVVTGHTRDDQIETVFMRALRGAGPRGLAALYARSGIVRPLLESSRRDVLSYARSKDITFVTDPSNADLRHLRNRVRLEILPRILASRPAFGEELLAIARAAADWRARIEAVALTFPLMTEPSGTHSFARPPFAGHPAAALRVLWPALAARAGVVLDWRGTERLAAFTIDGETGQSIQLAGGVEVRMEREALVFAPLATRTRRAHAAPRGRSVRPEGARAG